MGHLPADAKKMPYYDSRLSARLALWRIQFSAQRMHGLTEVLARNYLPAVFPLLANRADTVLK